MKQKLIDIINTEIREQLSKTPDEIAFKAKLQELKALFETVEFITSKLKD